MDLWDVAKLMARRWYVAAPMLLVTLVAALWVTSVVKPDYEATTNVTLLPPTVRNDSPNGRQQTVNPWDTESLTIATLTYLNSKRLHDQMAADGYSQVWSADTDIRFRTLIIITVTASGPEKAQGTAKKLQELVTAEVTRQQERYNLKPGEEITTIPFDNGDNLETKTSKAKRALIVVAGVGLILTVAFTVGLDALLRWRAGRRRPKVGGAALRLDGPTVPVASPAAALRKRATPAPAESRAGGTDDDSSEETRAIILTTVKTPRQTEPVQMEDLGGQEDATIVLPLSNTPWMGKRGDRKSDGKATENGKR
ncbi:hypothetical protein WEI85_28275 [Actinomycetes bacterium KLBMP 9797]